MARASYIYLIGQGDDVLAAFTVKRQAYEWLARSMHRPSEVHLSRMEDNPSGKTCGTREKLSWERYGLISAYIVKHKARLDAAMLEREAMQYSIDQIEQFVASKMNTSSGFCHWCGARVPPIPGEGTCNLCAK